MKLALYISVILNFILLSLIIYKYNTNIRHFFGGKQSNSPNIDYYERIKHLDSLPIKDSAIVFLGDSFIEKCEWNELLDNKNIVNRGVSSDNIIGLNKRINKLNLEKSSKIIILIGSNDFINKNYNIEFKNNFESLINNLLRKIKNDKIYIISILPSDNIKRKNIDIIKGNKDISILCYKYSINYIDIYNDFLDTESINAYTYDGLHLSSIGYMKLRNLINNDIN